VANEIVAAPVVATNQSITNIRKLLVEDYHSTNEHDSMTSALAHQLIAEQLKTNTAFLEWASNATVSVILEFATNADVPIYGISGLTADTLQLDKVSVNGQVGLYAEAEYDRDPTNEGPLEFIVEGGIHPTLLRVQNRYRLITYQLSPQQWGRDGRKIGRMDWSQAAQPLAKEQVDTLARKAFHEMTGLDLSSFQIRQTKIDIEPIVNPDASHSGVTVTGNLNARLYTPQDKVYPFVEFRYDDTTPAHPANVAFSGQMVQTSTRQGQFVELFAVLRKTEAVYELGEKFLGQGTWEQPLLDHVNSLNTDQRGEVYRRIFSH
jgi:hypothetical protein